MNIVSVAALLVIAFALAWRYQDTMLGVLPLLLCGMGLVLYVLAYFNAMSLIDWLWLLGGILALVLLIRMTKKNGGAALKKELRRVFLDPHLWCAVIILAAVCLCLRGEQILEWDGYNFWGPDTKSFFYRDGYAPKYSNAASKFGDYTPMPQLIWWWFTHLAGEYQERYVFMGYYIFGALLLFAVADRFRFEGRWKNLTAAVLSCVMVFVLPGVADTAWFRALCVDPLMAMLFGLVLSLTVCRGREEASFRKAKIIIFLMCLTLIKSIGILWSVLALLFWVLWKWREKGMWKTALLSGAGILACYGSWSVFCKVMERSTGLVSNFNATIGQRVQELLDGVFLTSGNNRGYIVSYAKAFLLTPIHRESTPVLDISPAVLVVILFAAAILLWKLGFTPKGKTGRLMVFMAVTLLVIYLVMGIGQMTMFYTETKYLDPVNAVTLLTRYCSPAHIGLLMLLLSFASGQAEGCEPVRITNGRRAAAFGVAVVIILSCGAYTEMYRRFRFDELDAQRIEKRALYTERYAPFLEAAKAVSLEEERGRILLCIGESYMNPIVINAASPVSFWAVPLTGDGETDLNAILSELENTHAGYLYLDACGTELEKHLTAMTGQRVETGVLYRIVDDANLTLERVAP